MTHILFVITDLKLGGVPLHLYRLVQAMRERGFQTTVACLSPDGEVAEMLRAEGITVHSTNAQGRWDVRILERLRSIIESVRPDMVHSFLFHANQAVRYAVRRGTIPASRVLCEIQTVEVERRWHLWVDAWTHNLCRCTIGNSPSVIEHLHHAAHIPMNQLHLVKGGIDPTNIQNARRLPRSSLGLTDNDRVILWVGRLDPIKGLDNLIDATERHMRNENVHLVLAGDGPLRGALQSRIESLGLTHRIHLLGSRRDVPSVLKTADLFVFPSRTEGLPNALLEAMAAGLPIVTTDVPGCRDLIQHERTGLVVPFGDIDALGSAMSRLLEDRNLANRLALSAAKEVAENWHQEKTIDGYAELYKTIQHEGTAN
ncbi:MAG: glycosyltransferase [Planctomycetota bacterium]